MYFLFTVQLKFILYSKADWESKTKYPTSKWPATGKIVFENYSTRYRPGLAMVLNGLTCVVNAGEKVTSIF